MDNWHNFFHENRKYSSKLNGLPSLTMSDEEIALWVLKGGHGDWLELDLHVDTNRLANEYQLVKHMFTAHRDDQSGEGTHNGWSACTLHGISHDKTNVWQEYGYDNEPVYTWTEAGVNCPCTQAMFESMPAEQLARVRFMKLDKQGWVSPHSDGGPGIDWDNIFDHPLPINIAVDHPRNCFMTIEGSGVVPFVSGKAFLVNILKNHSVANFSNHDRIHIIGHLLVGNKKEEYCKFLANSYRKAYVLQR